jgi:hypothetical protein
MYTKEDLKDLSSYLHAKEYFFIPGLMIEKDFSEEAFKESILQRIKMLSTGSVSRTVWVDIFSCFFSDYKLLPTLIHKYTDIQKEVVLWRLERGI